MTTSKKVTIDTSEYVNTWGKEPSGTTGSWAFNIGGDIHFISGSYRVARERAKEYARELGYTVVAVLG